MVNTHNCIYFQTDKVVCQGLKILFRQDNTTTEQQPTSNNPEFRSYILIEKKLPDHLTNLGVIFAQYLTYIPVILPSIVVMKERLCSVKHY